MYRNFRNLPAPFLPKDNTNPFGIQGLHCALLTWLNDRLSERANAEQWIRRVKNLSKKGLRAEELGISGIEECLNQKIGKSIDGAAVIKCLAYRDLELNILPMVRRASSQLMFSKVYGDTTIKRIKPKLKGRLKSRPQLQDPVLGYWIDVIDWNDLLGHQRGWIAFTYRGQPITTPDKPFGLCESPDMAWKLADEHAKQIIPKLSAQGRWSHLRLTGGKQYREWLVTMPHHKYGFVSSHFGHRNIVLHVRCDIRENANGGRVLVLQEVQSDWAQNVRRAEKVDGAKSDEIQIPPWSHEWPALALKLMLLHAAHLKVAALAWTPGSIQVERYEGLGKNSLIKLYDRTLPSELNKILRPYKRQCESIDVYVPENFLVEPADVGYVVEDEDHNHLGTAATWAAVQDLLPDGAHEKLIAMHGISLDETLRQNIQSNGFYAWGSGIH